MSMPLRRAVLTALLAVAVAVAAMGAAAPAGAAVSEWYHFAPYTDMADYPPPSLSAIRTGGGAKDVTLAFVTAVEPGPKGGEKLDCSPRWGGWDAYPTTGASPYQKAQVDAHKAAGGRVVVSFGGQAGYELALICPDVDSLTAVYQDTIAAYGVDHVDFDIEGDTTVGDETANRNRGAAIARLQQEAAAQGRTLRVSLTVATNPTGPPAGVWKLIDDTLAEGAKLSVVNIMAMDYDPDQVPNPSGKMFEYARQAALATRDGLRSRYPGVPDADLMRKVGVTPMIGINDYAEQIFTVAEAGQLAAWGTQNGVGMLGEWQTSRDRQCDSSDGGTTLKCSGVTQAPWAFTKALGGPGTPPPAAPATVAAGWSATPTSVRGDFDGDGFGDLAVGSPGESAGSVAGAGAVHVLRGAATGMFTSGSQQWTQGALGVLDAAERGDRFGASLAAGDFNGDGISDLAIGVPGENAGAGAVSVLYGSAGNGLTAAGNQLIDQDSGGVLDSPEAGDGFGASLATGDLLGTAAARDLVVGVPGEDSGTTADSGAVHVLGGSAGGLTGTSSQLWDESGAVADDPEPGDRFGAALAAGNLDGAGRADVAIGVPGEDVGTRDGAGAVVVLRSTATGPSATGNRLLTQDTANVGDAAEAHDAFGSVLAAGRFGSRTTAALAVGVPLEDYGTVADSGTVHVLPGTSTGPTGTGSQVFTQPSSGAADPREAGDRFGAALAAANLGGTSAMELAVGIPGEGTASLPGAGAVQVLGGGAATATGLATSGARQLTQDTAGVPDAREPGDHFGAALTVSNFDGTTTKADLAVGVPDENVGSLADAGAVQVFLGGAGAVTPGAFLRQGGTGIPGVAEAGDRFGGGLGR